MTDRRPAGGRGAGDLEGSFGVHASTSVHPDALPTSGPDRLVALDVFFGLLALDARRTRDRLIELELDPDGVEEGMAGYARWLHARIDLALEGECHG